MLEVLDHLHPRKSNLKSNYVSRRLEHFKEFNFIAHPHETSKCGVNRL
jgi:hypothetical protein